MLAIRPISFAISLLALGPVAVSAQDWTGEVYGGAVFERTEDYGGIPFDLGQGTALGFGVYERNLVPDIELGLDVMYTEAGYTGFLTGVESLSLMLNARLPFEITPTMTGYVGAGIGAIRVTYDGSTQFPAFTGDDTVAGAQLGLGVRYDLAATSIFAELKHQFAFDDATIAGVDQSYATTSAIIGLRFAF